MPFSPFRLSALWLLLGLPIQVHAQRASATIPLDPASLAAAPSVHLTITPEPGHGTAPIGYDGPQLWGRTGNTAVLAMGEIVPQFEGKQVLLALRRNGRSLGPGHWKLVVPGDHHGGRGMNDVVRIVTGDAEKLL